MLNQNIKCPPLAGGYCITWVGDLQVFGGQGEGWHSRKYRKAFFSEYQECWTSCCYRCCFGISQVCAILSFYAIIALLLYWHDYSRQACKGNISTHWIGKKFFTWILSVLLGGHSLWHWGCSWTRQIERRFVRFASSNFYSVKILIFANSAAVLRDKPSDDIVAFWEAGGEELSKETAKGFTAAMHRQASSKINTQSGRL